MVMDYTFFYVEANIICIIIFALLLLGNLGGVDRQEKQRLFAGTLISHMLYFFVDIAWVLMLGGYIPSLRLNLSILNILLAVILSTITCFWFVYVEVFQGGKFISSKKGRFIAKIPVMAEGLLMVFLFVYFPDLVITEDNKTTAFYSVIFLTVPLLYISGSVFASFYRAFLKENFAVKSQYMACGIYPLIITLFGVVQRLWFQAPLFCFGCAVMMIYFYIQSLNDQISLDDLTRLNNRTQLKKYVASESTKQGEKTSHFILMIDLNKFKYINDQYGHIEGDMALRRAADALREACSDKTLRTFIARFGGDEFIVIAKTKDEERVKQLCSAIKETLVRINTEASAPYDLTASIGYSRYSGDLADFSSALEKADEALYEDKKNRPS